MATIACPNCTKEVSADLYIHRSEKGFTKITLGMQCNTCKATYSGNKFITVMRLIRESQTAKKGA